MYLFVQRKNLKKSTSEKVHKKVALCSTECVICLDADVHSCWCQMWTKELLTPISSATWYAVPSFPVMIATSFFPFSYHLMSLKVSGFPPSLFLMAETYSNTELSFPLDFREVCC